MERITCCQHKNEDGTLSGCNGHSHIRKGVKYFSKGYCNKHYTRLLKYGDANYVERIRDGKSNHYLYTTWAKMINRCRNVNYTGYKDYGGRGISVCDEWKGDFGFWKFVEEMGERHSEKHSVDRINNDGNYCKENCRWADNHEQHGNKRNNNKTVGVRKHKTGWSAILRVDKIPYTKSFPTEQQAIDYRKYLVETHL